MVCSNVFLTYLRLEKFESQEKLAEMICKSGENLSSLRKEMMLVNVTHDGAMQTISDILQRASPYVQSYKKHTKTAKDLLPGSVILLPCTLNSALYCAVPCCSLRIAAAKREAAGPKKKKARTNAPDEDAAEPDMDGEPAD